MPSPSIANISQLLTPNVQLETLLAQSIQMSGADKTTALIYLELRHLQQGHYRDRQIELLFTRLHALLRTGDALFQLDSHSALLLLNQLNGANHAVLAAHRAQQVAQGTLNHEQKLYPQIGIALAPEHGINCDTLIDAAKFAAHQFAQDHIGIYDPSRDWLGQQLARLEIPLREALQNNQFHLAFQPQINLATQQVSGLEVLLRWQHPKLGAISPYELIAVAEHLGLMDRLTQWVIQSALRSFSQLRQQGYAGSLSLNLAPNNLRDPDLAGFISNALAIWDIPAKKLILEITESAVIDEFELALKHLEQIKQMGCKLALDDFGTGYSSLSYLKRLPIDELKIDRSFIMHLATNADDRAIVQSVIELAQRLNLSITAEGVENISEIDILQQFGCNAIQGYYYSRPLTLEDTLTYLLQRAAQ